MSSLLNRTIRQVLYSLKIQYSDQVSVYRLESSATDYATGEITSTQSSIDVRRCIVLPMNTVRDLVQGANFLRSANAFSSKGKGWDKGTRGFIFEAQDLRNYQFEKEDWLVYHHEKYDISDIETLSDGVGWLVIAKKVIGHDPEEIIRLNVSNALVSSQVANGSKSS